MEVSWYKTIGDISPLLEISPDKTIIFDTETTGFDAEGKDEMLQLSIVDGNGKVLFSSYLKPEKRRTWSKAEEVNGISPAMVKNAPRFTEVYNEVQDIFDNAELIVGYNVSFDLKFIKAVDIKPKKDAYVFDVMKEFAPVNGNYDSYYGNYKWCKLTVCARHYGYRFNAHDALEDTQATRHCFYEMLHDEEGYLKIVKSYGEKKAKQQNPTIMATVETIPAIHTKSNDTIIKIFKIISIIIGALLIGYSVLGFTTYPDDKSVFFVTLIPGILLVWLGVRKKKNKQ